MQWCLLLAARVAKGQLECGPVHALLVPELCGALGQQHGLHLKAQPTLQPAVRRRYQQARLRSLQRCIRADMHTLWAVRRVASSEGVASV